MLYHFIPVQPEVSMHIFLQKLSLLVWISVITIGIGVNSQQLRSKNIFFQVSSLFGENNQTDKQS